MAQSSLDRHSRERREHSLVLARELRDESDPVSLERDVPSAIDERRDQRRPQDPFRRATKLTIAAMESGSVTVRGLAVMSPPSRTGGITWMCVTLSSTGGRPAGARVCK